jgi:SHAQKYF class myb-like DNA-binding protein
MQQGEKMSLSAQLLHVQQMSLNFLGRQRQPDMARTSPPSGAGFGAGAGCAQGRWTEMENAAFVAGLKRYGRKWPKIQRVVKTRNLTQIRTHAQKFFKKIERDKKMAARAGDAETVARLEKVLLSEPSGEDGEDLAKPSTARSSSSSQRVRPRTDRVTGQRLHLASEDAHTPSHTDKRVRAFQHNDPQLHVAAVGQGPNRTWTENEEFYAECLIKMFYAGRLTLQQHYRLLPFLVLQLNIPPQHIEQKYGARCDLRKEYVHQGGAQTAEEAATMKQLFLKYDERRFEKVSGSARAGSQMVPSQHTCGRRDFVSETMAGVAAESAAGIGSKGDFLSETRIEDDDDEEDDGGERFSLDVKEVSAQSGAVHNRSDGAVGTPHLRSFSNMSISSSNLCSSFNTYDNARNDSNSLRPSSSGISSNDIACNDSALRTAFGSNDSMLMRNAFGSSDSCGSLRGSDLEILMDMNGLVELKMEAEAEVEVEAEDIDGMEALVRRRT